MGARRSNSERKWALGCVGVVLICATLAVGACVLYRYSLSREVKAKLDAIREKGLPVTLAEHDEWYPLPPPGENAAEVFQEAFSRYAPAHEGERLPLVDTGKLPPPGEPLPAEMKEAIAAYLAGNEEALGLLHKAAAMKRCRFPVDLTRGLEAELPHLSELRHGARLLALEAALHAENGEADLALESVISCHGIGRSLAKEPVLISHLLRTACHGIAILALERALARIQPTDEQLARLSAGVAEAEDLEAMKRAFVGERCMGIGVFTEETRPQQEVVPPNILKMTGLWHKDFLFYLDRMARHLKATQLPLPERLQAGDAERNVPRYYLFSQLMLPALRRAVVADARNIGSLRTAGAAVAVERYRLARAKLPAKLADLVPKYLEAVPQDPFDGKPLRYMRREKGYIVYSIGENGKDDGGTKGDNWRDWLDVPFIVER